MDSKKTWGPTPKQVKSTVTFGVRASTPRNAAPPRVGEVRKVAVVARSRGLVQVGDSEE